CYVPSLYKRLLHYSSEDQSAMSDQGADSVCFCHQVRGRFRGDSPELDSRMQPQCLRARRKSEVLAVRAASRRRTIPPSHTTSSYLPCLFSLSALRSQVRVQLHVEVDHARGPIFCTLPSQSNAVDDKEHLVAFD